MKPTHITLEIRISPLEGKKLPDQDDILHSLIERLHDYIFEDAAVIDQVHITSIDGQSTH